MRVGLLYERAGTGEQLGAAIEQIVAADRLGFDSLWIGDRHGEAGVFGAVPIVLAALAKRTRAIRLGSFLALARGNPVRTAEDLAMVDLLSDGRLAFGVRAEDGRGEPAERGERLREALEIVLAAWAFDEFSYGGRHFRFPSHTAAGQGLVRKRLGGPYTPQWECGPELPDFLTVTPKPRQQPRPPVWVLGDETEWVRLAGDEGHSVVLPAADLRALELAATTYETALGGARRARHEVELAVIVDLPLDGDRVAAGMLADLHRLHGATGVNHLIWRVPHPAEPPARIAAALRHFAAEVQPLLQA